MSARCCLCGHVFHVADRVATAEHVSHRDVETCKAVLRAERDHAVTLAFWQGVCAERLQHHEDEVRFFATFEREENKKVREWHRRRAEELRRWALEVPAKGDPK